jgi:hypothetical protein
MTDVKLTPAQRYELKRIVAPVFDEDGKVSYPIMGQLHDLGLVEVTVVVTDLGREVIANG